MHETFDHPGNSSDSRRRSLHWLAAFAFAAVLAACGGGGSEETGALVQSADAARAVPQRADTATCSYAHVYVTVERVRVLQQFDGAAQWIEIALTAPRRIDLVNLGGGVLQALGLAPLPAGHSKEVRLVLTGDDASGIGNAVQPTGGSLAPLTVPGGSSAGLKLKGEFHAAAGQTADIVLVPVDVCDAVVQAGRSGHYILKPEIAAQAQLLPEAGPEAPIAAGEVMPLIGGGYVVSRQPSATVFVIQRHDAAGQPIGGETTVAPAMGPADNTPIVTPLVGGGYAVIWLRTVSFERFGGSVFQLMTQSFTATGAAMGSPLAIAETVPGRYFISRPIALPKLAPLAGGGYVVVWALPPNDSGVYAQRFNAEGTPAGAVQQVTADGSGYLGVIGLSTGGYMVTWGSGGATGFARAYSSSDVPLAPAQPAGPSWSDFLTRPFGTEPTILAPLANGGAVIVWLAPESFLTSTRYVHVLQLGPDATPSGTAIIVDGSTVPATPHIAPAAAALPDGGFVVAWIEAGEVHARRFSASGAPAGPETRVNLITTAAEGPTDVVALGGGGFMISWSGLGPDGIRSNYSRLFSAGGLLGSP
jgi:hypothetical protein